MCTANNVTKFPANQYDEECPVHGGEVKKEYTFGRYADATIFTHHGCNCCVLITNDLGGIENETALLDRYRDLRGLAALNAEMVQVSLAD